MNNVIPGLQKYTASQVCLSISANYPVTAMLTSNLFNICLDVPLFAASIPHPDWITDIEDWVENALWACF
jgi:hypothetical protein